MTLQLLVDESADSHALRRVLSAAGHHVVVAADAGLLGADDDALFTFAQAHHLTVLTRNPEDFRLLAEQAPQHAGLLLIYRDNDPTRDMTSDDIVRAIANLLAAGLDVPGQVHTLNHWRY